MDGGGSSQVRRKLTKKPPTHHHAHSLTGDVRFDAQSLNSKRSSTSLKRAPSAPPQRNSNASSSPRHPPTTSQISHPSPILHNGEFLPSTFSPVQQSSTSRTFPASPSANSPSSNPLSGAVTGFGSSGMHGTTYNLLRMHTLHTGAIINNHVCIGASTDRRF
jgi:p21-activated kinase 1